MSGSGSSGPGLGLGSSGPGSGSSGPGLRITLNEMEHTLEPGKSFQIKYVLPAETASCVIFYSSSNDNVASVSSTGKVAAKKTGSAIITVKTFNGKTANLKISVKKDVAVTKVKVSEKKLVLGVGESYTLQTSVLPKNATNKKLTYHASNKKASVTSKGKITAKRTGICKITVKASNVKKAIVQVHVKRAPKKITLNASEKTLKAGKKFQIKPALPKNTASRKITYVSIRALLYVCALLQHPATNFTSFQTFRQYFSDITLLLLYNYL